MNTTQVHFVLDRDPIGLTCNQGSVCLARLAEWLLNHHKAAVERAGIKPELVEEVVFGNVLSAK